jgi:hypothetical protein
MEAMTDLKLFVKEKIYGCSVYHFWNWHLYIIAANQRKINETTNGSVDQVWGGWSDSFFFNLYNKNSTITVELLLFYTENG